MMKEFVNLFMYKVLSMLENYDHHVLSLKYVMVSNLQSVSIIYYKTMIIFKNILLL